MEQIFSFNWSHIPAHINPVFCSFGLVKIHWYGLMYGVAFLTVYLLVIYRIRTEKFKYSEDTIFTFMLYSILGVLIGSRLGNLINGELYGRVTTLPWGMYFPLDPTHQLRHPSQLYEAFFEGIFLFLIFWSIRRRKYFDGFFLSLYFIGYGLIRFFYQICSRTSFQCSL